MSGHINIVTGPLRADGEPDAFDDGTGYRIGDSYTLTAGHVVFEYDRNYSNPSIINS